MDNFTIYENGLVLEFVITEDGKVKFIHYGRELRSSKEIPEDELRGFRLVEVEIAGLDRPEERHGTKHIVTAPGYRLVFEERKDYRNANGRKLEIITKDEETEVYVTSHFQFYDGISIIRTWQTIENRGEKERILTYIDNSICEPLTIAEICQKFSISRSSLQYAAILIFKSSSLKPFCCAPACVLSCPGSKTTTKLPARSWLITMGCEAIALSFASFI